MGILIINLCGAGDGSTGYQSDGRAAGGSHQPAQGGLRLHHLPPLEELHGEGRHQTCAHVSQGIYILVCSNIKSTIEEFSPSLVLSNLQCTPAKMNRIKLGVRKRINS